MEIIKKNQSRTEQVVLIKEQKAHEQTHEDAALHQALARTRSSRNSPSVGGKATCRSHLRTLRWLLTKLKAAFSTDGTATGRPPEKY